MPRPQIPDELLAKIARRAVARLARTDRPFVAERVLGVCAQRVRDRRLRADLLGEAADAQLGRGLTPRHLVQAYGAELVCADAQLKAGHRKEAAASLTRALLLAFHRVPHIDRLHSPLSDDPAGFTARLRSSAAARAVAAPRGRKTPPAAPPADRPLRLLVVNRANANFLGLLTERYANHPGVELRTLDLAADPELAPLAKGLQRMIELPLGGQAPYGAAVEAALRPHLDWADTVFVEWCSLAAAFMTLVDPGSTRIVVRLHKYESFTYWPHIMDFSRVDDIVFIAEHMREMTTAAVPRLLADDAPHLRFLHNALDLRRFDRPKNDDARFTVGLVGIGQIAKDPRWALEVLRLLRARDERYRLLMVGGGINPEPSPAAGAYHAALEKELAELEPSGAVHRLGPSDDVAGVLAGVGVILSSSVREGCHVGLMEGAASGAVPVVRDWPFVAGRPHSTRTLFPEDWVVTTPQQAADRILALTASEDVRAAAGREASRHALSTWDWETVRDDYDHLLLGADRDVAGPPTPAGAAGGGSGNRDASDHRG
ncbi:glycosyltransferase [Streptomyces sp. NPDC057496]|uniref:glycosyltransferase n=1 Tax=Streptomyces sp. NPDC057496 TaxID=3346149 RepID=UPI00368CC165